MSNSSNKWPVNATLLSAIIIYPPIITSITSITSITKTFNIVTLTWIQDQVQTCLPITNYNIFQNNILIKQVPGILLSTEIIVLNNNINSYYIIAENTTAKTVSDKSNIVSI